MGAKATLAAAAPQASPLAPDRLLEHRLRL